MDQLPSAPPPTEDQAPNLDMIMLNQLSHNERPGLSLPFETLNPGIGFSSLAVKFLDGIFFD